MITKALEKDRELRYQTAGEIRADLKRLKRDSDSDRSAAVRTVDFPAATSSSAGPYATPSGQLAIPGSGAAPATPGSSSKVNSATAPIAPPETTPVAYSGRKKIALRIIGSLVGLALLGLAGFYSYSHRHAKLTERDSVLVTDFTNTTGHAVFDGTLRKALTVGLEQSPFLNVVSDQKIQESLKYMRRAADERITTAIGREICQRDGIKAMISGSIAPLGEQYVISLDAVNVATGDSLGQVQIQASSKEQVLNAMGKATAKLREKLGESLASVQKFDQPLERATTTSLEALQEFTRGESLHIGQAEDMAAMPHYLRATELDPNFAVAIGRLGTIYNNLGQYELSQKYLERAMELRDRASERERLYIEGHYYDITGQLEKSMATWEVFHQAYPRDATANDNLAASYILRGQFDKALAMAQEQLRVNPEMPSNYTKLATAYRNLNRLDEAKATIQAGLKNIQGENAGAYFELLQIAIIQNDQKAEQQARGIVQQNPQQKQFLTILDANLAASSRKDERKPTTVLQSTGNGGASRLEGICRIPDGTFGGK